MLIFKYKRGYEIVCSVLYTLATLVEILQEVALSLELDLIVIRETLVASIGTLTNGIILIHKDSSPDVAILNVVQAIVRTSNEAVNFPGVSCFVVLTPVSSKLQLRLLRGAILA